MPGYVGTPSETTPCWVVELPNGRGIEFVHAEKVNIEGGAILFSNGDVFGRTLLAVYSATGYLHVYEANECPHRDDE